MLLLGRKTARERVASFLLAQLAAGRPCDAAARGFHLPMTRTDIADYLGLTIETVSRTMTRLKAEKLIALPTPAEVVLLDRDRLEALAGGFEADHG
jgi:CRP/FNR family transcriptional regulator